MILYLRSSSCLAPRVHYKSVSSPQHWSNISTSIDRSVKWPQTRSSHAATHLSGSLFVIVGGVDYSYHTLNDMWLCDTTFKLWIKVFCRNFLCSFSVGLQKQPFSC